MKREFSINIIILLVVNFLVKPLYIFVIEAGIQNLTGPEAYGQYFVLYDFVFLCLFLNDAGIQNYNTRFVASNRSILGDYFSQLLGFKILAGAIFFLVTVSSSVAFGYWSDYWPMLLIIIGVFFLNSVFVLLRSSLSALGYYRWDSYMSALDKILLLIGLGVLVWRGYQGSKFEIIWFPTAQLIAALIATSIAVWLLKKSGLKLGIQFSWKQFKKMVQLTLPYALILLFSAAYNRADAVMLDQLLPDGEYQAGLYAAAYRFIEAGNMVGFLFASLLLPMFSNMISEKQDAQPLFDMAFKVLFFIGIIICLSNVFYADEIYRILYAEEYQNSSSLLSILMLSFVPVSLAHCFGSFLIADGKLKAINIIFLIGLILNVIGNYVLIPEMKAEGAAYVTFLTQTFLLLGMALYLHSQRQNLKILSLLFKMILMIVGLLCIFFVTQKWDINWKWSLMVALLASGIFVILMKWINVSSVLLLLKKKN